MVYRQLPTDATQARRPGALPDFGNNVAGIPVAEQHANAIGHAASGLATAQSTKVLTVEDDPAISRLLKSVLEGAGMTVVAATTMPEGLRRFFEERPSLAVLDLMMPGGSGFDLIKRIREMSEAPMIVLSARSSEADKVQALESGADDYMTKPFGGRELVARILAVSRRTHAPLSDGAATYQDAEVRLDVARHDVVVRGETVALTPIEFRLLATFVRHPFQVLTPENLLDRIWGSDSDAFASVKWHIGQLRHKIEQDPEQPKLIVTVRGVGYRYQRP